MSSYQDETNEPFLPKDQESSLDGENHFETFEVESEYELDAGYWVVYQGNQLFINSRDWRNTWLLKWQILVAFSVFVLFGLAEQAIGALIPIFQKHYHVSDIQTSFLFLSSITGYIMMGLLNGITHSLFGLRGVLLIGTVSMCVCYFMFSLAPPFWFLVFFSLFNGIGCGVLDAACNAWVGGLTDSNQILGILHGCYGLGCLISPTLISFLLERKENPWVWNHYYRLLLGFTIVSSLISLYVFRYETSQKYKYALDLQLGRINRDGEDITGLDSFDHEHSQSADLKDSLKSKLVWFFSVILFLYVGGEVAFGSWLISFLLRITKLLYKKSSHIATTFWTGLMLGRTALGFVTASFFKTELTANWVYIFGLVIGYIIFNLITLTTWYWLYYVIVLFTGIMVGPIFPTTIVSAIGILPAKYHTSGVGFICAFGGGGAAGLPFLIGLIANSSITGLRMYPIVILAVFSILLVCWSILTRTFLPSYKRPT